MNTAELALLHEASFVMPRPWGADEFASLLSSPHVWMETEGQGFALGRAIAGEAELLTLAVAPDARRRGTGRRLLERLESAALARGAGEIFLEVAADNAPAIGLYISAGYVIAGRRRGYYQSPKAPPIDALVMRKPLDQAQDCP